MNEEVMEHIFNVEGGYVNHPSDKGGATNFGITRATLRRHRGKRVTNQDVKNMTLQEASEIYEKNYFKKANLHKIKSLALQTIFMDQVVNRGVKAGSKLIQKSYNNYLKSEGLNKKKLVVDGIIGPKSLRAINNNTYVVELTFEFIKVAQLAYIGIAKRNNSQVVF